MRKKSDTDPHLLFLTLPILPPPLQGPTVKVTRAMVNITQSIPRKGKDYRCSLTQFQTFWYCLFQYCQYG